LNPQKDKNDEKLVLVDL